MIRNLLIFFSIPFIAYFAWQKLGAPYREPGAYLNSQPAQRYRFAPPIEHGEDKLFPIAWYQLDALLVATREYDEIRSPVDFGVVWGPLLAEDPLNNLRFSHSNRYLHYSGSRELTGKASARCMANVHIIPADDTVRSDVMRMKRGDYVSLKGSLVQVFGASGSWSSSLSRNDRGEGACEVFYVTEATRFDPGNTAGVSPVAKSIAGPASAPMAAKKTPDAANFSVIRSAFPKEILVTRELEIPVEAGTMLIHKGEKVVLLDQQENSAKAKYGNFTFWISARELENNLVPQ